MDKEYVIKYAANKDAPSIAGFVNAVGERYDIDPGDVVYVDKPTGDKLKKTFPFLEFMPQEKYDALHKIKKEVKDENEDVSAGVEKKVEKPHEDNEKVKKAEPKEGEVYECAECGKEFNTKIALTGHMRTHKK